MKLTQKVLLITVFMGLTTVALARNYMDMEPKIIDEADVVTEAEAIESDEEQDQIIRILLGTEDTAGQYTMFSDTFKEKGGKVPAHTHDWHDEAFYVTRGQFKIVNGDMGERTVGPNTLVFTPRGSVHAWESLEDDSHFVVFYTPGGWEHFYQAVRKLTPEQREDEAFMEGFMSSYDENFQ
jgi:quercetin dioxygenase-like cupin family protein